MGYLRIGIHRLALLSTILILNACGETTSPQMGSDAMVSVDAQAQLDMLVGEDMGVDGDAGLDADSPDMTPGQDAAVEMTDMASMADQSVDVGSEPDDASLEPDQTLPVDASQLPPSLWSVMAGRGDMAVFLSLLELTG